MELQSRLQKKTPTPYSTSDNGLENDRNDPTTLYLAIFACGSFYLILALWILYTSYCATQNENQDPDDIYEQSIRQTIADKLNELQEAAPIELLGSWLISTRPAEVPYFQYNSITCSICLDPVLRHHPVHTLRCHHVFHDLCLERWFLRAHNSCPLCHMALVEVCDICQDFMV